MSKENISQNLIIVTPVYEDVVSFSKLLENLKQHHTDKFYVVAVDDGSVNQPVKSSFLRDHGVEGVVISLKANLGHQRAIAVGLNYLNDRVNNKNAKVVIMDSDGEDKPESIQDLLMMIDEPKTDVVVAKRLKREETMTFKLFYVIYKIIFRFLTGREINFGNFMVFKQPALARLVIISELWTHVAASVLLSKLRIQYTPISRGKRYDGQSKMNFSSLVLHGFKALMVFIEDILVRIGISCAIVLGLCFVLGGVAITLKLIGFATPGWFSVSLGIMVIILLQTGTITLMTLMMTGLLKKNSVNLVDYSLLINKD